jgi:hypothetical protein
MWKRYRSVQILLRKLAGKHMMAAETQAICYEVSGQLECHQQWFDCMPETWKQSRQGRSYSRLLYRLYSCINSIENIA